MATQDDWSTRNNAYLSATLDWLRKRLAWQILQERTTGSQSEPANLTENVNESVVTDAAAIMMQAESVESPPALILLGERFGLSQFERDILLLCASMELDRYTATLCAQLHPHQPYPTFALAISLFTEPAWDALSPVRPLRHWQLIEINQSGNQPLTTSPLRADERIVNYIKGLNYLDDRLAHFFIPFDTGWDEASLAPSQHSAAQNIVEQINQSAGLRPLPLIQLLGSDGLSKQLVAQEVVINLGVHLNRLPAEFLPQQAAELETFSRLWQRETLLVPQALYIDAQELENSAPTAGHAGSLFRFLARTQGLVFLATREIRSQLGRTTYALDIAKPAQSEQQKAWKDAFGGNESSHPGLLAGQFSLNLPDINQLADKASLDNGVDLAHTQTDLWEGCLMLSRPRLESLAQRLEPKATWEDLVLPDKAMNLLRQIADQARQRTRVYEDWGFRRRMNRGLGINALFTGDSGTGKTMAAEVIANDLNLDLYRIDLSGVVSKYIGETEKNLRQLFDAAEDGGAILFFDEADALFGKRSEIKDSHDRYANIEINYLLQRIESYRGLAILASNMKSALDKAFLRRLRFLIDFPFPGLEERIKIWQHAFPDEMPLEELDWQRLAHFNLTGGSVHNIAINAAFLAAERSSPVTMPLLFDAIRTELNKLERPINEVDFAWQPPEDGSEQDSREKNVTLFQRAAP